MQNLLQLLLKEWWSYDPNGAWPGQVYHGFNLLEGCAWIVIAVLVLRRHLRFRNSRLELLYAFAFILFGLSDFQEAYRLQSWLILAKGVNLAVILGLRWYLLRRYYPQSHTF